MISQKNKSGWRNPWVWAIVIFIVIVLAVNTTFVWFTMQEGRSELIGIDYKTKDRKTGDELLNDLSKQLNLTWTVEVKQPKSVILGTPAAYEVAVKDKNTGEPVSGALEIRAYRAASAAQDFFVPFEEVAPGEYQGYVDFPLKGYWEIYIEVQRDQEHFTANAGTIRVLEPQ